MPTHPARYARAPALATLANAYAGVQAATLSCRHCARMPVDDNKKRPRSSLWAFAFGARSSSKSPKRRGQSGKGARCAPLGLFIGYGAMMIGNGQRYRVCCYVLRP